MATPTPRPRRWPHRLGVALATLLLVGLAALVVLLGTARGLQWLVTAVHRYGGDTFQLQAAQGRLLDHFTLDGLVYRGSDGLEIRLARIDVRWSPWALLDGRLHLRHVAAHDLQIQPGSSPSPRTSTPPTLELPVTLPVAVQVDDATLDRLTVARGDAPLAVTGISLKGHWAGQDLQLETLTARLAQTGPLRLRLDAHTRRDRLEINALTLDGPGTLSASGVLGYADTPGHLQLQWRDLRWPLVAGDGAAQLDRIAGSATLKGTIKAYTYTLKSAARAQQKPVTLTLDGRGDDQQTQLARLSLDAGAAGSLTASGTVRWAPSLAADIDATVSRLDPGVFVAGWHGALNGTVTTRTALAGDGATPKTAFTLDLKPSTLRGRPLTAQAQGEATPSRVDIKSLTLRAAGGTLAAKGTVAWAPRLDAALDLRLQQLDPGLFDPDFPGALSGTATITGDAHATVPTLRYHLALDHSRLRGQPLTVAADGIATLGSHPQVTLQPLKAALGATHLEARGRALPPFDLQAQLSSPNLAVIAPDFGGTLDAALTLRGDRANPHLVTHGDAKGLKLPGAGVSALDWRADLQPDHASTLKLTARDADAGISVHRFTLDGHGTQADHQLTLTAETSRGDVDLTLAGGFNRKRMEWGGRIRSMTVTPAKLAPLTLEHPAGLLLGTHRLSLEPACLDGTPGRICVDIQRAVHDPGIRAHWTFDTLKLAALQPLLPKTLQVAGVINGDGHLRWLDANIADIATQLSLKGGALTTADGQTLRFQPSTLALTEHAGVVHGKLDVDATSAQLHADLTAGAAATLMQRPLSGSLQLKVPDLKPLKPFVPQVTALAGRIDGALDVAGTLAQPRLRGHVALDDGQARLTTAGITLSQLTASVTGTGDGPLQFHASMTSGGGDLTLDGQVDPTRVPMQATLKATGQNFQIVDIPDVRAWISPDLSVSRDGEGLHLAGILTVPKADITPRGGLLSDNGISPSSDQVIVGAPQQPRPDVLNVHADVVLAVGDDVAFQGYGLTTKITGRVRVTEQPRQEALGLGALVLVDGHYKAYGQDLNIKTGRLIFTGGPVTKPAIDIVAVRKPREDIQVGVQVRGTLDKPQLSLTSSPAMPQEQQLSWLLFGQPMEQNSSATQSALASAALSLGLSGGGYFANRIGKKIGIDTVSVGSPTGGGSEVAADPYAINGSQAAQAGVGSATVAGSNAAQLTLGKYLTPDLYVSYGVSLFQPGQTFRLQYSLGHGFKLQTESGVANGGDIIYTFERGH